MYDVAIIGSGPAGLSAALNLKLHNKDIIWFGNKDLSSKVKLSEKIANYPGIPFVTGNKLNEMFTQQIDQMQLKLTEQLVNNIGKSRKGFMIQGDNDIYEAKTILLCIGASSVKGLENEVELLGRGVSYCATCDGFLYKGKTIVVYSQDSRFNHEIKYLASLASKVYVYSKDKTVTADNIEYLTSPIIKVNGENKVEGITLSDSQSINCDGVFFLRNSIAPTILLKSLETNGADIVVDRQCNTNIEGCFAAGDCTGRPYQIAKAVGEGNVAAHTILEYLDKLEG